MTLEQAAEYLQWPKHRLYKLTGARDGIPHGKVGNRLPSEAARQMVDVLLLCRELSPARVELAIRGALAAGAHDGRAGPAHTASAAHRP